MSDIWDLKDPMLPENLYPVRDVFLGKQNSRKEGESLHDFYIRKGVKCPCRNCNKERKAEALKNQETMF